jgi:hypothetical protein
LNFFEHRGDIRKSRSTNCVKDAGGKLPPVSTTPVANFATSSACVVDTGGKFTTAVNDHGGKFAAGVNDAGGKLPPVSNNGNNIRLQTP